MARSSLDRPRSMHLLGALALACAVSAVGCAVPEEGGEDESGSALAGSRVDRSAPRWIVEIGPATRQSVVKPCTGIMIAEDAVLTASACLPETGSIRDHFVSQIDIEENRVGLQGLANAVDVVYVGEGDARERPPLAILRLDRDVVVANTKGMTIPIAPLAQQSPERGASVRVYGFGPDDTRSQPGEVFNAIQSVAFRWGQASSAASEDGDLGAPVVHDGQVVGMVVGKRSGLVGTFVHGADVILPLADGESGDAPVTAIRAELTRR